MRFERAQRSATKVQQQARRICGNPAKGLALFVRSGTMKPGRKEILTEYQHLQGCGTLSPAKGQRSENRIELLPGAPAAISCKVYPLNRKETDILQIFLEEEERNGCIPRGSSPYTVPVFFV